MGTKLFVGNLSYSTTEPELRDAFALNGRTVLSVRIALDRETQRPRGFAFVEVGSDADADAAIKEWNGNMLSGRNIFVEKAQERVPGAPRPAPRPRPFGGPGGGPGGAPGGFRGPGGPGGFRPGGPGGAPGGFRGGPPRFATATPEKDEGRRRNARPEKQRDAAKKKPEGRPEERERGKWRWDGKEDD
jgi:RNA recognition motif-containing protein